MRRKIKTREEIIKDYIQNKKVLDLGFLGEDDSKKFSYLREFLLKYAKEVIGVDLDKKRIDKLKKEGYNVIYDDVTYLNNVKKLGYKFDVVVAGEIIEHLDNPGLFLDNVKDVLKENGVLIITTPNILALRYIWRYLLLGQENPNWKNREMEIRYGHVNAFTKLLLENLLLRKGYKIL